MCEDADAKNAQSTPASSGTYGAVRHGMLKSLGIGIHLHAIHHL